MTNDSEMWVKDLAKCPHLLIAGEQSTGKHMLLKSIVLSLLYKKGPDEANTFFSTSPDTSLLCLERLRGKPGLPFVYFISYFNPQIPMTVEEDMSSPLYEILEKKYGIFVKTSKEMISARGANAEMADKLGIQEGDPVLVRKRFVLDINNVPVEYNIGYYRADRFTYTIEFTND